MGIWVWTSRLALKYWLWMILKQTISAPPPSRRSRYSSVNPPSHRTTFLTSPSLYSALWEKRGSAASSQLSLNRIGPEGAGEEELAGWRCTSPSHKTWQYSHASGSSRPVCRCRTGSGTAVRPPPTAQLQYKTDKQLECIQIFILEKKEMTVNIPFCLGKISSGCWK